MVKRKEGVSTGLQTTRKLRSNSTEKLNEELTDVDNIRNSKEKKSISTKTFAHGMMDVSLLTSNATQLRAVLASPTHELFNVLILLISLSIILQLVSSILLIVSDFFKTQVKEKDNQNVHKRKLLNFIALSLTLVITTLNILISAFYTPTAHSHAVIGQSAQPHVVNNDNISSSANV